MAEAEVEHYGSSQVIFREGDPAAVAYMIDSGSVEISSEHGGKKMVLAHLGEGDIFGELALISQQPRSATATALEPTQLSLITPARLQEAMDSADPLLAILLRGNLGRFIWTQRFMLPRTATEQQGVSVEHQAHAEMEVEKDIDRALENDEFELAYQPVVDMEKGHIAGFEALIRWRHPERGMVSPAEFMDVAELSGQIVPMGRRALELALEALTEFQQSIDANCPEQPPLFMSVNVSGRQLLALDEVENLNGVLQRSGVSPERVKLEITESFLVDDPTHAAVALQKLRDKGVRLAIDDFGTGYSSLSYLHLFPLDTIKIDRSFVQEMLRDQRRYRIVRAIAGLARDLDASVIAEGVETQGELKALQNFQSDYVQGFLFARPMTHVEARRLLAECPGYL